MGDDSTDFSSSFTEVFSAIYGSGFFQVNNPTSGHFINLRRNGKGINNENIWNAMSMKAYETPNLLSQNGVTITSDTSTGEINYEATNLI